MSQRLSHFLKKHQQILQISELSQAYENAYGVLLDPTAVFGKSWTLLVSGLFKAKLALSLDKVGFDQK